MTIKKATITCILISTPNIESWCQKVLDLLDFTFADLELHGTLGTAWTELSDLPWTFLLLGLVFLINDAFLSFKQGRKIVDFMEYSRYFHKPKPR